MKWFTFKHILFAFGLLWAVCPPAPAQQAPSETAPSKYDKRVQRYQKRWNNLIPSHFKLQYAGNMGLLSLGGGWDYGKRDQWETDLLFGFLPAYSSDRAKMTITLKQNYMPWNLKLKNNFSVEPLACGIYLNTVLGDEFWTEEPDRYPKGYYGFSSRVRANVFLGQRLTYEFRKKERMSRFRSLTFFYEISTSDLYIISAFNNSYLRPRDYLSLSFGLKAQIF